MTNKCNFLNCSQEMEEREM